MRKRVMPVCDLTLQRPRMRHIIARDLLAETGRIPMGYLTESVCLVLTYPLSSLAVRRITLFLSYSAGCLVMNKLSSTSRAPLIFNR